jgi:hypothetical protein
MLIFCIMIMIIMSIILLYIYFLYNTENFIQVINPYHLEVKCNEKYIICEEKCLLHQQSNCLKNCNDERMICQK